MVEVDVDAVAGAAVVDGAAAVVDVPDATVAAGAGAGTVVGSVVVDEHAPAGNTITMATTKRFTR